MPSWSVRLTTAIRLIAVGAMLGVAPSVLANDTFDPVEQWLDRVAAYAPAEWRLSVDSIRRKCGGDILCVARYVAAFDDRAYLQKINHPDTDTIRWVKTRTSLSLARRMDDGRILLALNRFGRKADREIRNAIDRLTDSPDNGDIILDLRKNSGGNFDRMLRVASLFTGPVNKAVLLVGNRGKRHFAFLSGNSLYAARRITVLVGPETASSGEILTALLRRYAGAEIVGSRTYGKDYLLRIIPVNQDWRLFFPAERVEVPGETISGGLLPDRPIPESLADLLRDR